MHHAPHTTHHGWPRARARPLQVLQVLQNWNLYRITKGYRATVGATAATVNRADLIPGRAYSPTAIKYLKILG